MADFFSHFSYTLLMSPCFAFGKIRQTSCRYFEDVTAHKNELSMSGLHKLNYEQDRQTHTQRMRKKRDRKRDAIPNALPSVFAGGNSNSSSASSSASSSSSSSSNIHISIPP